MKNWSRGGQVSRGVQGNQWVEQNFSFQHGTNFAKGAIL